MRSGQKQSCIRDKERVRCAARALLHSSSASEQQPDLTPPALSSFCFFGLPRNVLRCAACAGCSPWTGCPDLQVVQGKYLEKMAGCAVVT
eukprot:5196045-Amphidinium_carterae.1